MAEQNKSPKVFNDPIHGHIELHPLLVKIIDTPHFQRLRSLKQLGGVYYVFPGACHNRFEHCIGVSHLAGKLVKSLKTRQDLDITETDELCVQIAGLCHDLGHGPFSHLFEEFMKEKNEDWTHEKQTIKIFEDLEELIKSNGYVEITNDDINFIKELICGPLDEDGSDSALATSSPKLRCKGRTGMKSFLYDIVANHTNGIDVDKMDYFGRDCHHLGLKSAFSHERFFGFARVGKESDEIYHICMRDKEAMNIYELFHTRNRLHQQVCHHRVKTAVERMILDVFKKADPYFNLGDEENKITISAAADEENVANYLKLIDGILYRILEDPDKNLKEAKEIIKRISERRIYKLIGEKKFKTSDLKPAIKWHDSKMWKEKVDIWVKSIKDPELKGEEFEAVPIKLDYGRKMENPVDSLMFYSKDQPDSPKKLGKNEVSYILPDIFAEVKAMVFYKGENGEILKKAKKNIDTFWDEVIKYFLK